jgi:hypothetical protein
MQQNLTPYIGPGSDPIAVSGKDTVPPIEEPSIPKKAGRILLPPKREEDVSIVRRHEAMRGLD